MDERTMLRYVDELQGQIDKLKKMINGGVGSSVDYNTEVTNLPKVNNITLKGNKKSSDLKIAFSMTETEYAAATKNTESIYCLQENAGTITDSAYVNLEVADWTEVSGVYKQTKPFVFEVTPAAGWTIEDVSIEKGIATIDSYEVTEDPFGLSITYATETLPEYGITATVTVTINQPAGKTRIVKDGVEFGSPFIEYSTTERKIGKWIDGSDLYEKTFDKSAVALTNGTWNNDVLGTHLSGINIVAYEGQIFSNGVPFCDISTYYRGPSEYISSLCSPDSVNIYSNLGFAATVGIITIRYTKTS